MSEIISETQLAEIEARLGRACLPTEQADWEEFLAWSRKDMCLLTNTIRLLQADLAQAQADAAAMLCQDEDYLCGLCEADWTSARPTKCRKNPHPGQALRDRMKEFEGLLIGALGIINAWIDLGVMDKDILETWKEQARAAMDKT